MNYLTPLPLPPRLPCLHRLLRSQSHWWLLLEYDCAGYLHGWSISCLQLLWEVAHFLRLFVERLFSRAGYYQVLAGWRHGSWGNLYASWHSTLMLNLWSSLRDTGYTSFSWLPKLLRWFASWCIVGFESDAGIWLTTSICYHLAFCVVSSDRFNWSLLVMFYMCTSSESLRLQLVNVLHYRIKRI